MLFSTEKAKRRNKREKAALVSLLLFQIHYVGCVATNKFPFILPFAIQIIFYHL